jgi:cytochrome c oxidase subunit 2
MFFNQAFADVLPIAATDIAVKWDFLYEFLLWLSVFSFVLVVGAMIYFAVRYRNRPGHKPQYITGSHLLEAIWVGVPTVLLLIIFGWGYSVYREMKHAPSDAYEIKVIAKQWAWTFLYDNGTATTGVVYVPVNKPVKLLMTSQDVLHGFFIPNFRVKQDAVPGMYTSVWFEATVPGKHQVFCTEYCGTSHSGMLAQLVALEDADWNAFLRGKKILIDKIPKAGTTEVADNTDTQATDTPGEAPAGLRATASLTLPERGQAVYNKMACAQCHSVDGSIKAGPSFKGLFGSQVALSDGKSVIADENYIRESIEDPNAKIVKGFAPQMPTFKGLIKEEDLSALISYIKSVK